MSRVDRSRGSSCRRGTAAGRSMFELVLGSDEQSNEHGSEQEEKESNQSKKRLEPCHSSGPVGPCQMILLVIRMSLSRGIVKQRSRLCWRVQM